MKNERTILITGATGYLGRQLVRRIPHPLVLTRDPQRARAVLGSEVPLVHWAPGRGGLPAEAVKEVGAVVHLAGEPLARGRWTPEKKKEIASSRIEGTRALIEALERAEARPEVFVSASAIGCYGDRGDEVLTESSPRGEGFLADLAEAWEAEARGAERLGARVVTARIGLVFGAGGGVLAKQISTFRVGLGGTIAGGRHWMSWIHLDDAIGLLLHAVENEAVRGAMNVTAPHPVRNAELTRTLSKVLGKPALLPMPRWLIRAALGEMSDELVVSQQVIPEVAQRTGYAWQHPELEAALRLEACPGSLRTRAPGC